MAFAFSERRHRQLPLALVPQLPLEFRKPLGHSRDLLCGRRANETSNDGGGRKEEEAAAEEEAGDDDEDEDDDDGDDLCV